jgi:hypothetical protein
VSIFGTSEGALSERIFDLRLVVCTNGSTAKCRHHAKQPRVKEPIQCVVCVDVRRNGSDGYASLEMLMKDNSATIEILVKDTKCLALS